MLTFPPISPILIELGPLAIRWYGVAYILGIFVGALLIKKHARQILTADDTFNLMTYVTLGILLGGRLGYVLFYDLGYYLAKPGSIFAFWEGGMSFHGGALGSALSLYLFAKIYNKPFLKLLDALSLVAPIGLFLGRLANFVNGELVGRLTSVPWAMVFPGAGPFGRHPSQLYEAIGEGILLGVGMVLIDKKKTLKPGQLVCVFLTGYGAIRFIIEFFREPDPQVGLFWNSVSMGQLLCLTMVSTGIILGVGLHYWYAKRNA